MVELLLADRVRLDGGERILDVTGRKFCAAIDKEHAGLEDPQDRR